MNTKQLIAAVAVLAASGSALAQQTFPYVDFHGVQTTGSHTQVVEELRVARATGNHVVGGHEFTAPDAGLVSTKTRAQVVADLEQAKADGSYVLAHQEFEGQFPGLTNGTGNSRLVRSGKPTNLN